MPNPRPLKTDEQAAELRQSVVAHFQRNGLKKADGGFLRDHVYKLTITWWPDGIHRIHTEAPSPADMEMDYASRGEFDRYWNYWSTATSPTPAFQPYP